MWRNRRHFIDGAVRWPRLTVALAGGKAHNLYRLSRSDVRIPAWGVVPSTVFARSIRSVESAITAISRKIDYDSAESIESASGQISRLIFGAELPETTLRSVFRWAESHASTHLRFAVRSSCADEDSTTSSFAGQMDSYLNVPVDGIPDAIRKVWASTYSARALLYRHRRGITHGQVRAAVIIQVMVPSAKSGVMFTRDPQGGDEVTVISAAAGLGEGVVQGTAEVDNYRVQSGSPLVERVPGRGTTQPGTVLSDREIHRLARIGAEIERIFGSPQDIEWTFDARGYLYILQTRPITHPSADAVRSDIRLWDNSNVVESYPGLTLPLTFSFVRECYEVSFRNATLGFLLNKRALAQDMHIFRNMIGLINGRVYYCLLNWYRMLSYLPGFQRHRVSWDQMIGISQTTPYAANRLSLLNRIFAFLIVVVRLLSVKRTARRFFRQFSTLYTRFRAVEFEHSTGEELLRAYEQMREESSGFWHLTLYNDFCAMKYYDWLKRLCAKWAPEGGPNIHNDLLCGVSGVESVRPVLSLLDLARTVEDNPIYARLFDENDDSAVLRRVRAEVRFAPLKAAIESHLDRYGDRGLEELKLENPTFREAPERAIGLIREYRRRRLDPEMMTATEGRVRDAAEKVIRKHLNPVQLILFRLVLKRTRTAVVTRENMRFARTRLFGILRRLFRRMGTLFVSQSVIRQSDDLHYLTVEEIFAYVRGASVTTDLRGLTELRKYEYGEYGDSQSPGRFETRGIPYANPLVKPVTQAQVNRLRGIGCATGVVEGTAWVVDDPTQVPPHDDCILVARSTDPGWIFLMVQSRGIVVERGSLLSHTAIVGRELGIPTVVGVEGATHIIPQGARVCINGTTGEVICR